MQDVITFSLSRGKWLMLAIVTMATTLSGSGINCQTVDQSLDLQEYLFQTVRYNTDTRPVQDQSQPIQVRFSFTLSTIQQINEVNQYMTLVGVHMVNWNDELLRWNPMTYGGIGQVTALQDSVWRPKVVLGNPTENLVDIGSKNVPVKVLFNGTVFWSPPGVFTFGCDINVQFFPFDTQTCYMYLDFGFSGMSTSEVVMVSTNDQITLDTASQNGEWELLGTKSYTEDLEINGFEVQLFHNELKLKRRSSFIVLHSILPVILLSLMNILVFVLPEESGEKISYAITMFLTFAIFITMLSDTLPRNSLKLPYYSIYLITVNVMSTLYVILTVIVLKVYHGNNGKPVPRCISVIIRRWKRICSRREASVENVDDELFHNKVVPVTPEAAYTPSDDTDKEKPMKPKGECGQLDADIEEVTWIDVSKTIDSLFLIVFIVVFIILCVVFFFLFQTN